MGHAEAAISRHELQTAFNNSFSGSPAYLMAAGCRFKRLLYVATAHCYRKYCERVSTFYQWRTEGGFGVFKPPRNSEDIGGVLDRISKKNRRLDFLLQFTVFSYGCNLLNKGFF